MLSWMSLVVLLSAQAEADADGADRAPPPPEPVRSWSTDLADPAGLTRFHLVTRANFTGGQGRADGAMAWSYEARAHIRLTPGVALTAIAPIGLSAGRANTDAYAFFGNLAAGVTFGGTLIEGAGPRLRLVGGVDAYFPTSPDTDGTELDRATVAAIRAYEPQLYLSKTLSFRGRTLIDLEVGPLTVGGELGIVPAVSLAEDREGFALLLGGMFRASVRPIEALEPYLELGGMTQVAGDGEIAPPFFLTPGIRFHIADAFDPAIFVSINFINASAVVIGLDLATVLRPTVARPKRNVDRERFMGGID